MQTVTPRLAYQLPDAAALCGVSIRTLYALNSRGTLTFVKVGRRTLVRHDDLAAYLSSLEPVHVDGHQ